MRNRLHSLTWKAARDWCNQFGCTLTRVSPESYAVNFKGAHSDAAEIAHTLAQAVAIAARRNQERLARIMESAR